MTGDGLTFGGMVYVVDDDAAVRDSLTTLLEVYGLGVEAFDSVAAFKRGYHGADHGCLVLDQHMPVVTGLQFLASAEGRQLRLPVILVTAHNDSDTRARAAEAGVFAFLAKPVDGDELVLSVTRAMSSGCAERAHRNGR